MRIAESIPKNIFSTIILAKVLPFNKLISTQTATYSYNANGNMLSKSDATGYWIYSWDYENRMVTARKQNKIVRYQYDAQGKVFP